MFRSEECKGKVYSNYDLVFNSWKNWAGEIREKWVETEYGTTYTVIFENGKSETIVLLHGMFLNLCMWNYIVDQLSMRFNLVLIDIPWDPGKTVASINYAESKNSSAWLDKVLQELDLRKANIVGASLGGWIGLQFSERYPDRVRSLVIVSPHPIRGADLLKARTWKLAWYALLIAISPALRHADKMIKLLYSPLNEPKDMDYNLLVSTIIGSKMRQPPGKQSTKSLSKIKVPTLLLVGEYDSNFNKKKLCSVVNAMQSASYEIVDNAGHALPFEKPTYVSERIGSFIDSVSN